MYLIFFAFFTAQAIGFLYDLWSFKKKPIQLNKNFLPILVLPYLMFGLKQLLSNDQLRNTDIQMDLYPAAQQAFVHSSYRVMQDFVVSSS
jgi:hypothetical protein